MAILRMPKGLDYSHLNLEVNTFAQLAGGMTSSSSVSNITQLDNGTPNPNGREERRRKEGDTTIMPADSYLNLTTLAAANGNDNGNRSRKWTGCLSAQTHIDTQCTQCS